MSQLSTHVLDTSRGQPAAGITVRLEVLSGADWCELGRGITDVDGRVTNLLVGSPKLKGDYRLRFAVGEYFLAHGQTVFYPEVIVTVHLDRSSERYHLPLLLNPYGYSTYRGS